MKVGEKTRRWLTVRKMMQVEPESALMGYLSKIDRSAEKAISESTVDARKKLEESIRNMYRAAFRLLDELEPRLLEDFERMVKERIESLPHLKGDPGAPGKTPVKGVDYNDGAPGAPGSTPVPDIDYPTIGSIKKFIEGEIASNLQGHEKGMPAESVMKAITKAFEKIDPEVIARALETLKGEKRLDYEALKNRPGTPVGGERQRTLHRGGGSSASGAQTYEYDLSDFCDGSTKMFTIPTNTRIVAVLCTDAPAGFYRKTVDYTGTGTTTLTLDAAVAAPNTGASLSVLYVV